MTLPGHPVSADVGSLPEVRSSVEFNTDKLSKEGQAAYARLLEATVFEQGFVGFAGLPSQNITAFNVLLKEKEADAAFKSLLDKARTAGQLYALSGLFYTDHKTFIVEIEKFKSSSETVNSISGCIMAEEKVAEIVASKDEKVAIIKPGETIEDFRAKHTGTYYLLDYCPRRLSGDVQGFCQNTKEAR
jgi:hypothetical protein